MISLFSSQKYDEGYETAFWNEIFGCVNYLNLPYDTVMNMPIHIRKFWIEKHNKNAEEAEEAAKNKDGSSSIGGEAINSYALLEQNKQK